MKKSSKIVLAVILAVVLVFGLTGFVGAWSPQDVVTPTEDLAKDKDAKDKKVKVPAPEDKPPPVGIMPVYVLSGSDYEIGYQYGQMAAPEISAHLDIKLDSWARSKMFDLDANPATPDTGITTKKDRDYVLAGFHQYLERDTPEIVDQLCGMADGCTKAGYPIDYADAVMLQWCTYAARDALRNPASRLHKGAKMPKCGKSRVPENYYTYDLSPESAQYLANLELAADGNCCTQCAATLSRMKNEGETIVASSWDWHYRYEGILVVFPTEHSGPKGEVGNAYVISGKIGSVGEGQFLNSAGCGGMFD